MVGFWSFSLCNQVHYLQKETFFINCELDFADFSLRCVDVFCMVLIFNTVPNLHFDKAQWIIEVS